jgi:hypothetical protein
LKVGLDDSGLVNYGMTCGPPPPDHCCQLDVKIHNEALGNAMVDLAEFGIFLLGLKDLRVWLRLHWVPDEKEKPG